MTVFGRAESRLTAPSFTPSIRPDSLVNFHTGENYDSADDDAPHVAYIKSTPNPKSKANLDDVKGVGGVFMMLLEGIVVGVGALMCAIGSWFAHKFYKGEKLPFELLAPPSAAEEAAMLSDGKANVPRTGPRTIFLASVSVFMRRF